MVFCHKEGEGLLEEDFLFLFKKKNLGTFICTFLSKTGFRIKQKNYLQNVIRVFIPLSVKKTDRTPPRACLCVLSLK